MNTPRTNRPYLEDGCAGNWLAPPAAAFTTLERDPQEIVNGLTHGTGLVLSLVGARALLDRVSAMGDPWRLGGCSTFMTAMVAVYAASVLSHLVREPAWKRVFRVWDQGLIYLLIAGTYTPFALAYLRSPTGWSLTVVIWVLAGLGFLSKVVWGHKIDGVAIWWYIVLGWLPLLAWGEIKDLVPGQALGWVLAGGIAYSAGTIFLAVDDRVPFFHAVWHSFVLAGSACHFLAVWRYVVPLDG